MAKQPVAWNDYCTECWLNELQGSMDRCTSDRDITEMMLKRTLNPYNKSKNIYVSFFSALSIFNPQAAECLLTLYQTTKF